MKIDIIQKAKFEQMRKQYNDILVKYQQLKQQMIKMNVPESQHNSFEEQLQLFKSGFEQKNLDSFFSQRFKYQSIIENLQLKDENQEDKFDTFRQNEENVKQAVLQNKNPAEFIQALQKEISVLKTENQNLLEQIMATEYPSTKNDMNIFNKLSEKNEQILVLTQNIEKQNQDLLNMKQLCKKQQQQVKVFGQENFDLKQQIDHLKNEMNEQAQKQQKKTQKLTKSKKSNIRKSKGYSAIYRKNQNLKIDNGFDQMKNFEKLLKIKLQSQENQVVKLKEELNQLLQKNKILQQKQNTHEESQEQSKKHLDILINSNNKLKSLFEQLKKEKAKQDLKLSNLNMQLRKKDHLDMENNSNKNKIEDYLKKLQKVENERNYLHGEITEFQTKLQQKENMIEQLKQNNRNLINCTNCKAKDELLKQNTLNYQSMNKLLKERIDNQQDHIQECQKQLLQKENDLLEI